MELTPDWAFSETDHAAMGEALAEARKADALREVPVGAVVVAPSGEVVARAHNRREAEHDPTAHAEVLAMRAAAAHLGDWRLEGHTLYVTLEPCAMCAGACGLARLDCVIWGAPDPVAGFVGSRGNLLDNPGTDLRVKWRGGLRAPEASALLEGFFAKLRGRL
jgi:tRNA(adenine34) deaminase